MSYPQPDSDLAVIGGGDYFRLNTLLASGGDIYESKQSGLGFAIGPDSDIANVNVAYFDGQNRNFINQLGIAPDRSFVGRVDANNAGKYAPIQRPSRVLIWPDDRWDPLLPARFSPHGSGVSIVEVPRLDVIQYFREVPSLVPRRRDKTWFYQALFTGGTQGGSAVSTTVVIPYYGRRYAKIILNTTGIATNVSIGVSGADIQQKSVGGFSTISIELGSVVNVGGGTFEFIINGGRTSTPPDDQNTGGMYDLLEVTVKNASGADANFNEYSLKIITSDTPGGATS